MSAGTVRNFLLDDPLLDWLDLYGKGFGFQHDHEIPGYDSRTDYTRFIFEKGHEFERAVVDHLSKLKTVVEVAADGKDSRNITKAETTLVG